MNNSEEINGLGEQSLERFQNHFRRFRRLFSSKRRGEEFNPQYRSEEIKRDGGKIAEYMQINTKGRYQCTTDIIFTDVGGLKFNFKSLLPRGWAFMKIGRVNFGSDFETIKGGKMILYGDLSQPGSLLGLLHEIGHARSFSSGREDREELHDPVQQYINSFSNRLLTAKDILSKGEEPEDYVNATVWDSWGKDGSGNEPVFTMLIPKSLVAKYGRLHAKEERNAWAYALLQLRKLRQNGFIIETTFTDINSLRVEIDRHLLTYDKNLERIYKISGYYV